MMGIGCRLRWVSPRGSAAVSRPRSPCHLRPHRSGVGFSGWIRMTREMMAKRAPCSSSLEHPTDSRTRAVLRRALARFCRLAATNAWCRNRMIASSTGSTRAAGAPAQGAFAQRDSQPNSMAGGIFVRGDARCGASHASSYGSIPDLIGCARWGVFLPASMSVRKLNKSIC